MSLVEMIRNIPSDKTGLQRHIGECAFNDKTTCELLKNPLYKSRLDEIVAQNYETYSPYFSGTSQKLGELGRAVGYVGDAYLAGTGDIIGSLGIKWLHGLAQIPEKAYGLWYGIKTGDFSGSAENLVKGALSYVPGLTFIDEGLGSIAKKRVVESSLEQFQKEMGVYKPWHTKLYDALPGSYETPIRDRRSNIISPLYP